MAKGTSIGSGYQAFFFETQDRNFSFANSLLKGNRIDIIIQIIFSYELNRAGGLSSDPPGMCNSEIQTNSDSDSESKM